MIDYKNRIQKDFEENLVKLRYSFFGEANEAYTVRNSGDTNLIKTRIIFTEPNKNENLISPNGNILQSVSYFKIDSINKISDSDLIVMGFINVATEETEFIIIPSIILIYRISENLTEMTKQDSLLLRFWLMDDSCLYDTTDLSLEGEWYFLSKGVNGRMADGTEWDYSTFLNNWQQVI